jgi:uncharacterized protein involved in exopolysaccharide biosynthesis
MTSTAGRPAIKPEEDVSASRVLVSWLSSVMTSVASTGRRGIVYGVLGGALGVALALTLPGQYTSAASFIARGASASLLPGALQGLAATVGIGSTRDYSPQFYADLVTSDPVLTAAMNRPYVLPGAGGKQTYLEVEGLTGQSPARATDAGLRHLRRNVAARADVRTNIISVSVTARYPELSRDLTQALLDALDSMNISFRQQQSRELRLFFESRVADAQRELDSAETALRHFLERNRVTQSSPLLTFEQLRLTRNAELKRAVYTTVVQQYEEAKMQEARNVPVLTVLTPPIVPVRKSGPPRRFIVAAGLLLGILAAIGQGHLVKLRQSLRVSSQTRR